MSTGSALPDRYKFGDVVEWPTRPGRDARWMIITRHGSDADGYQAVWIGHDDPPDDADHVGGVGAMRCPYGSPFLVTDDE